MKTYKEGQKHAIMFIKMYLDLAEADKEMSDNPEDPRIRIQYIQGRVQQYLENNKL